ncbi:unnamed protein product, partial [Musa textilis]
MMKWPSNHSPLVLLRLSIFNTTCRTNSSLNGSCRSNKKFAKFFRELFGPKYPKLGADTD